MGSSCGLYTSQQLVTDARMACARRRVSTACLAHPDSPWTDSYRRPVWTHTANWCEA